MDANLSLADGNLIPAAIYTRVSTDEQVENGYSLAGQSEICRKYAENNGMIVIQEFVDKGASGDLPLDARPQGKLLLDLIRSKRISAIVIATQDRLSRNLAHTWSFDSSGRDRGSRSISATGAKSRTRPRVD